MISRPRKLPPRSRIVERAVAANDETVGVRQQLLYRYLAAHPDLDDAVLAAVGDDVRPFVERIVRARQLGQARSAANPNPTPPSDTLPAWTIVDPLPTDELLGYYRDAEAATGIAWYWLAAIHLQETRMGRIIGTSSAGAVGPMQFLPTTWAQCCTGDPMIARDAIIGAATYLVQSGGPADMQAALHAYNPNDSYVATVTAFAENMRDNPQLLRRVPRVAGVLRHVGRHGSPARRLQPGATDRRSDVPRRTSRRRRLSTV